MQYVNLLEVKKNFLKYNIYGTFIVKYININNKDIES